MQSKAKISVLFVGNEPLLMEVPVKPVPNIWENWESRFAADPAEAFQFLARGPIDVVVADLNLPGTSGIDFLRQVRERYPLSGRIVYSTAENQGSLLDAFGISHQCLPYPCQVESFRATIEAAAASHAPVAKVDLRLKISQMERLPSLPRLYQQLVSQLQSMDTSIEDIAHTVSEDLGMTTQILKLVNSAYFGLPQETSNVREVIGFVGTETIKYLVLAIGVFRQFEPSKLGGFPLEALWHHSARTATTAKIIGKSERVGRQMIEDTVTAGLLHDVGQLVLASNYPEQYREIRRNAQAKGVEWIIEEREVLGLDHAEVGGSLLGLWGLPPALVEAVTFHHAPLKSTDQDFTALTAVHVANVLTQRQGQSYTGTKLPQVDRPYLDRIGQSDALERWREEVNGALAAQ